MFSQRKTSDAAGFEVLKVVTTNRCFFETSAQILPSYKSLYPRRYRSSELTPSDIARQTQTLNAVIMGQQATAHITHRRCAFPRNKSKFITEITSEFISAIFRPLYNYRNGTAIPPIQRAHREVLILVLKTSVPSIQIHGVAPAASHCCGLRSIPGTGTREILYSVSPANCYSTNSSILMKHPILYSHSAVKRRKEKKRRLTAQPQPSQANSLCINC
jgi:hypothetical protein